MAKQPPQRDVVNEDTGSESEVDDEEDDDEEEEEEEDLEDQTESESESNAITPQYYSSLRPRKHVCPFSDPSRSNPCNTLKQRGKGRKDRVAEHLRKMLDGPGDIQHPKDDSLWKTPLVTDYYFHRLSDLCQSASWQKALKSQRNSRYYKVRQKRQKEHSDEKKEEWLRGEISLKEYQRYLYGGRWYEAVKLHQLEQAKKVQDRLEGRITELEAATNRGPHSGGQRRRQRQQQLERFNTLNQELRRTQRTSTILKEQLFKVVEAVPKWFGSQTKSFQDDPDPHSLFNFAGWDYPTIITPETYYCYAALAIPMRDWGTVRPWSDQVFRRVMEVVDQHVCRRMLRNLEHRPQELKSKQEKGNLILAALNGSWQKIKANPEFEEDEFSDWVDSNWQQEQERLWLQAKREVQQTFFSLLMGSASSLVEMATHVEDFADLTTLRAKEHEGVGLEANVES